MSEFYYLVAANTPFNNSLLTYKSSSRFEVGDLVEAPLGKRMVGGCVLGETKEIDSKIDYKQIRSFYDDSINLRGELDFFKWISTYYHYPLGQLIFDILPKPLKRPREMKHINGLSNGDEICLESDQVEAWNRLSKKSLDSFSKSLVHGVTGSGKSYLYLMQIKRVLETGKKALFLVPEINLTPQFVAFFEEHLNVPIYLYHSDISNSQKYNLWESLHKSSEASLIIGVRSSIFIPLKNLGCIIVDEEHDNSFKQDDRCPYNARDIAIKKAQLNAIPIILGSATPAVETYCNFKESKSYYSLKKRYSAGELPEIEMVDLREADYGADFSHWPLPQSTIETVANRLKIGEQVVFFINKLGFANYVQCRSCGHTFDCPNCSVSLTVFKGKRELSCHSCTYKEELPQVCPECQNMNLLNKGFGTEKVKEVLEEIFKDKVITRFDRDEIKTTKKLEETLNNFHNGKTDILVGTQMISKGHNFRNVNLVVVLGIDSQMNYPDYRANERTYQLLTQISGRSGRFGKDSQVLIHTHSPENEIFKYILTNSFDGFYKDEVEIRKLCSCPPFYKLAAIYITSKSRESLIPEAEKFGKFMKDLATKHFPSVQIHGPRPTVIEKRANKFTWVIMLKSDNINELHNLLATWKSGLSLKSGFSTKVDIDPMFIS